MAEAIFNSFARSAVAISAGTMPVQEVDPRDSNPRPLTQISSAAAEEKQSLSGEQ